MSYHENYRVAAATVYLPTDAVYPAAICLPTDEWISGIRYIHVTECYLAIKK